VNQVYKMERIAELGGASVPFPFDLHAMLYSDAAPDLGTGLHHLFADRRLKSRESAPGILPCGIRRD
jgi:hypothetical protein